MYKVLFLAMPLTLYRRHTKDCHIHKTKLSPRAKRRFLDCHCPIWIYGRTHDALVPRQSTGTRDIAVAEAQRRDLEKTDQDSAVHGPRIDDCIERFLEAHRSKLGDKTEGAYQFQLQRLRDYCSGRGAIYMRDLSIDLLEDFKVYGLPKEMANTSRAQITAKVRCFLRVAFRRGWTQTPLAEGVTPHTAPPEQKEPYTDEEVNKILDEALKLNGGREGYASAPQTFRLLLELMLETGMRVSDAIRFNLAVLQRGKSGLWIYGYVQRKRQRTKQPVQVEAFISDRLKTAIDGCKWLSPDMPFWYGTAAGRGYKLGYQVYDLMQTIGKRCGVADCRPHRLRDTFAVRALLRGVSLEDVSRLLGHSSVKVTELYYAKWVASRKRRLESIVAQSLVNADHNALGNC
jgi:site-specific recombinase XerD